MRPRFTSLVLLFLAVTLCHGQAPQGQERLVQQGRGDLKAKEPNVRFRAAQTLGRLGADALGTMVAVVVEDLAEALKDDDRGVRTAAAQSLGKIGPAAWEALPSLVLALDDTEFSVRSAALRSVAQLGPVGMPALVDMLRNPELRFQAEQSLLQLGPQAKDAVPLLVARLKPADELLSQAATRVLVAIGTEAVPALLLSLKDKDDSMRQQTARVLGKLGTKAQTSSGALADALADPRLPVRLAAAEALPRVDPGRLKDTLAVLQEALSDTNLTVRRRAMDQAAWIGPPAALLLAECLKHANAAVRADAAQVLGQLGPTGKGAAASLSSALRDPDDGVRQAAATALVRVVPSRGKQVAPIWMEILTKGDRKARLHALEELAKLGPQAAPATAVIAQAFLDEDVAVRTGAAYALRQLGPAGAHAAPMLVQCLRVPGARADEAFRILLQFRQHALPAVVTALRGNGAGLAPWFEGLGLRVVAKALEERQSQDAVQRVRLVRLLESLSSDAREVVPDLIDCLVGQKAEVQAALELYLNRLAMPAASTVPRLTDLLQAPDKLRRLHAVRALGRAGPPSKTAAAALGMLVARDPEENIRVEAIQTLVRMGSDNNAAAAGCLLGLQDASFQVRHQAASAMTSFFTLDKEALPQLLAALQDPHPDIRNKIVQTLRNMGPTAIPALVEGTRQRGQDSAGACLAALENLNAQTPEALQAVVTMLTDPKHGQQAELYLERLRPPARVLAPLLAADLPTASEPVVQRIQKLYRTMGSDGAAALTQIMAKADKASYERAARILVRLDAERLKGDKAAWQAVRQDPDEQFRARAYVTLSGILTTSDMLALWEEALHDKSDTVRSTALNGLIGLGAQALPAAPALVAALKTLPPHHRSQVFQALAACGPDAVPHLLGLIDHAEVSDILGNMGPAAREAVPSLVSRLRKNTNGTIAMDSVAKALARIDPDTARHEGVLPSRAYWLDVSGVLAGVVGIGWLIIMVYRRRRRPTVRLQVVDDLDSFLKSGNPERAFQVFDTCRDATPQQRLQLLLMDQAYRWASGTPRRVSEYQARWDYLGDHPEMLAEIVLGDFLGAKRSGNATDPAKWLARFPDLAQLLGSRLQALARPGSADTSLVSAQDGMERSAAPSTAPPSTRLLPDAAGGSEDAPRMPSANATRWDDLASPGAAAQAAQALLPDVGRTQTHVPPSDEEPRWALTVDALPAGQVPAEQAAATPVIGRYVVERVLGEGAFGTVYLARDEELRRSVAIKVPKRNKTASAIDIEAYLVEARLVAGLDHAGIVPVYDVGRTDDGLVYVVSKLIPGTNLAQKLAKHRLPPGEVAAIILRVAEALAHAHAKGLVHRDIKPANLLIDVKGTVYVADFGLALTREDFAGAARFAGTPAYMSPEQTNGKPVDARSDLFSLGVVFYEMLTGQRPFQGRDLNEILTRIQTYLPPPVNVLSPETPIELTRICMRCLSKDPLQRHRSADELVQALAAWQKQAAAVGLDAQSLRLTPTRGRPFEARDAALYVSMLPGPHGDDHLPADLSFWKSQIEAEGATFAVGLLTGVAGSGKSSYVQAGLLPNLAEHVQAIVVPAATQDTERAWRTALAPLLSNPSASINLAEALRRLRERCEKQRTKFLFVIDQFERCLLGAAPAAPTGLQDALRQCDGKHLQVLLVVRTEYMPLAEQTLKAWGLAIEPGKNQGAVAPFAPEHAFQVLLRMGQAFRHLPEATVELKFDQKQFLHQVVDGLTEGGVVTPAYLGHFVRLARKLSWMPNTISQMGGLGGGGGIMAAVMESVFDDPDGNPHFTRHATAARALVGKLLPPDGRRAQHVRRDRRELQEACGYHDRPDDFDALVQILDEDLRLLCMVPPAENDATCSYRLGIDFGLAGLRRWINRKPEASTKARAGFGKTAQAMKFLDQNRNWRETGRRTRHWSRAGKVLVILAVIVLVVFIILPGFKSLDASWFAWLPSLSWSDLYIAVPGGAILFLAAYLARLRRNKDDEASEDEMRG